MKQDIFNLENTEVFKSSLYDALKDNTVVIASNVENEDIIIELTQTESGILVNIDNESKPMSINEFETNFLNLLYGDIKSDLIVLSLKQNNKND
jgi:hypothetical protein